MKQHSRCPWTGTEAAGGGGGTLLSGAGCGGAGTAVPPPREAGTCLPAQHRLFPSVVPPAPRGPGGAGLGPPAAAPQGSGGAAELRHVGAAGGRAQGRTRRLSRQ